MRSGAVCVERAKLVADQLKLALYGGLTGDDALCNVELGSAPVTRPGDLWQLGRHRLLCGDCTRAGDVARLLNGNKADSLITDPPYGVDYAGKNAFLNKRDHGHRIQRSIDNDAITDYRRFFGAFLALAPLASYNTAYIFMAGKELHSLRLALDDSGFVWGEYLIWVRTIMCWGERTIAQGMSSLCMRGVGGIDFSADLARQCWSLIGRRAVACILLRSRWR